MVTLVIKNLPDHLHAKLKLQAQRHRRSLTKEAVSLIESGLAPGANIRPLPEPVKLRSGRMLTIEDIETAIAEGRE